MDLEEKSRVEEVQSLRDEVRKLKVTLRDATSLLNVKLDIFVVSMSTNDLTYVAFS